MTKMEEPKPEMNTKVAVIDFLGKALIFSIFLIMVWVLGINPLISLILMMVSLFYVWNPIIKWLSSPTNKGESDE